MALHDCKRPDQTLTFPIEQAILVARDLQTLLDLQSLGCRNYTLDLGDPGDSTTFVVKIPQRGDYIILRTGYVILRHENGDYQAWSSLALFQAEYQILD